MSARKTNVKIVKFVLLALIAISILESGRLIFLSIKNYRTISDNYEGDILTGEKGPGYYAKNWMIASIIVLAITDLVGMITAWGVASNMSTVSLIYGIYMSCISNYATYEEYLRSTYVAFILPQIISIVAILYAVLNYVFKNDDPIRGDAVREMSKKNIADYEAVNQQPSKPVEEYRD